MIRTRTFALIALLMLTGTLLAKGKGSQSQGKGSQSQGKGGQSQGKGGQSQGKGGQSQGKGGRGRQPSCPSVTVCPGIGRLSRQEQRSLAQYATQIFNTILEDSELSSGLTQEWLNRAVRNFACSSLRFRRKRKFRYRRRRRHCEQGEISCGNFQACYFAFTQYTEAIITQADEEDIQEARLLVVGNCPKRFTNPHRMFYNRGGCLQGLLEVFQQISSIATPEGLQPGESVSEVFDQISELYEQYNRQKTRAYKAFKRVVRKTCWKRWLKKEFQDEESSNMESVQASICEARVGIEEATRRQQRAFIRQVRRYKRRICALSTTQVIRSLFAGVSTSEENDSQSDDEDIQADVFVASYSNKLRNYFSGIHLRPVFRMCQDPCSVSAASIYESIENGETTYEEAFPEDADPSDTCASLLELATQYADLAICETEPPTPTITYTIAQGSIQLATLADIQVEGQAQSLGDVAITGLTVGEFELVEGTQGFPATAITGGQIAFTLPGLGSGVANIAAGTIAATIVGDLPVDGGELSAPTLEQITLAGIQLGSVVITRPTIAGSGAQISSVNAVTASGQALDDIFVLGASQVDTASNLNIEGTQIISADLGTAGLSYCTSEGASVSLLVTGGSLAGTIQDLDLSTDGQQTDTSSLTSSSVLDNAQLSGVTLSGGVISNQITALPNLGQGSATFQVTNLPVTYSEVQEGQPQTISGTISVPILQLSDIQLSGNTIVQATLPAATFTFTAEDEGMVTGQLSGTVVGGQVETLAYITGSCGDLAQSAILNLVLQGATATAATYTPPENNNGDVYFLNRPDAKVNLISSNAIITDMDGRMVPDGIIPFGASVSVTDLVVVEASWIITEEINNPFGQSSSVGNFEGTIQSATITYTGSEGETFTGTISGGIYIAVITGAAQQDPNTGENTIVDVGSGNFISQAIVSNPVVQLTDIQATINQANDDQVQVQQLVLSGSQETFQNVVVSLTQLDIQTVDIDDNTQQNDQSSFSGSATAATVTFTAPSGTIYVGTLSSAVDVAGSLSVQYTTNRDINFANIEVSTIASLTIDVTSETPVALSGQLGPFSGQQVSVQSLTLDGETQPVQQQFSVSSADLTALTFGDIQYDSQGSSFVLPVSSGNIQYITEEGILTQGSIVGGSISGSVTGSPNAANQLLDTQLTVADISGLEIEAATQVELSLAGASVADALPSLDLSLVSSDGSSEALALTGASVSQLQVDITSYTVDAQGVVSIEGSIISGTVAGQDGSEQFTDALSAGTISGTLPQGFTIGADGVISGAALSGVTLSGLQVEQTGNTVQIVGGRYVWLSSNPADLTNGQDPIELPFVTDQGQTTIVASSSGSLNDQSKNFLVTGFIPIELININIQNLEVDAQGNFQGAQGEGRLSFYSVSTDSDTGVDLKFISGTILQEDFFQDLSQTTNLFVLTFDGQVDLATNQLTSLQITQILIDTDFQMDSDFICNAQSVEVDDCFGGVSPCCSECQLLIPEGSAFMNDYVGVSGCGDVEEEDPELRL